MAQEEFHSVGSSEITAFLEELRGVLHGLVRFDIARIHPPLDLLDSEMRAEFNRDLTPVITSFAEKSGLSEPDYGWREVSEKTGKWILQAIFMWDLAHNTVLSNPLKAWGHAHRFIDFVREGRETESARYYTSGIFCLPGPPLHDVHMDVLGFSPATKATFEAGVIMVTRERIGLLWVEEED